MLCARVNCNPEEEEINFALTSQLQFSKMSDWNSGVKITPKKSKLAFWKKKLTLFV